MSVAEVPIGDQFQLKVETYSHHPQGTIVIAETDAGPIYRIPLLPSDDSIKELEAPEELLNATSSDRKRGSLTTTFIWNSKIGLPVLGRPNSAFVIKSDGKLYVDHLLEEP